MIMNFNSQFNTNKMVSQGMPSYRPVFLGVKKGVELMNGDFEPKFVKLLCDYADFKESDATFNSKFVDLSKAYVKEERPVSFPNWFKTLFVALKKVNDEDFDAIISRAAITSADFKQLVFKTLEDFKAQEKHLNIIKRDYSRYINLDFEG